MQKVFFPRKIYPELKRHMANKQVTVLTGMRRTGKTTLVEHLLSEIESENKIFLDLEKMSNRELFLDKNYDNIILNLENRGLTQKSRLTIAIDEIQLLPNITSVIKYLNDHYNIKFILTGSSSYYLKNLFTESLAGRKKLFELFPLDFGEFLDFKEVPYQVLKTIEDLGRFNRHEYERLKAYYEEYIQFGGFPEVVLASSTEEKRDILDDIVSSYVNIDVKSITDFRDASAVFNLIKMLTSRIGTRLNYSKLSRLVGLARSTVQNYIELFERTYLISLVPVHTKNSDREIVKAKKIYFSDTGMVGILANTASGSCFENAFFNQLKHKGSVSYFALKSGREIDFIIDKKIAIETKETPIQTNKQNLTDLARIAGVKKQYLVGRHKSPSFSEYSWGGEIL